MKKLITFMFMASAALQMFAPVSYTHLDVYKRQILNLKTGSVIRLFSRNMKALLLLLLLVCTSAAN